MSRRGKSRRADPPDSQMALLSAVILLAAFAAPFGALSTFRVGFFELTATPILWVHGMAACGALVLGSAALAGNRSARDALVAKPVLGLLVLACAGVPATILAEYPWLSAIGANHHGLGLAWFVSAAVFAALAGLAARSQGAWRLLVAGAVGLGLSVAFVQGYYDVQYARGVMVRPILVKAGDGYAYLGLALPFLLLAQCEAGGRERIRRAAVLAAGLAIVLLSRNLAASAVYLGGLGLLLTLRVVQDGVVKGLATRPSVVFPALGAVILVPILFHLFDGWLEFDRLPPSVLSRILLADLMFSALANQDFWNWAFGAGWGHGHLVFFTNLNDAGASLVEGAWDLFSADMFHAHNVFLENLYSTGVFGMAVMFGCMAGLYLAAGSERRPAAAIFLLGYAAVGAVWFEWLYAVPWLAAAIAAMLTGAARHAQTGPAISPVVRRAAAAGVLVIGVALAGMTVVMWRFERAVEPHLVEAVLDRGGAFPDAPFPTDPRGHEHVKSMAYRALAHTSQYRTDYPPALRQSIADQLLARLAENPASIRFPRLPVVAHELLGHLAFVETQPGMRALVPDYAQAWHILAGRQVELAPRRTDVLVPYLSWLAGEGDFERLLVFVAKMYRLAPDDPVATYYDGVVRTQSDDPDVRREGLVLLDAAIRRDVERFISVPDWLKQVIRDAKDPADAG